MKILIADDSILLRNILSDILRQCIPDIKIMEATNGADAVDLASRNRPDLIVMDFDMPILDGLSACEKILKSEFFPILMFTNNTDPALPFSALKAGVVDFRKKPRIQDLNDPAYMMAFTKLVYALSRDSGKTGMGDNPVLPEHVAILVIGASTGGPKALASILASIHAPLDFPVCMVQHIEEGYEAGLAQWLTAETGKAVDLARNEMPLHPGSFILAPSGIHTLVKRGKLLLTDLPVPYQFKPSIDALFASAAQEYGPSCTGLILTGMGSDGKNGCIKIRKSGGFTIVQERTGALARGMPDSVVAAQAASLVLPLKELGPCLSRLRGMPNHE